MERKPLGAFVAAPVLLVVLVGLSCGSDTTGTPSSFADADAVALEVAAEVGPAEVEVFDFGSPPETFDFGGGGEGVFEECTLAPYEFGCPCDANTDCTSGYCVESSEGFVCTAECLEDCPAGWSCKGLSGFGSDIVFVCVPSSKKLCFPCKKDSQCPDGRCVPMGEESYCAVGCPEDGVCPDSFTCTDFEVEGGEAEPMCLPTSGWCDCLLDNAGELRPCQSDSEFGTCFGYEECDPEAGWGNCSASEPVAEICNGLDDDCDAIIDEDLPETEPCEFANEFGTCTGVAVCAGTPGWKCQAQQPAAELCDYQDNNCDGQVDEDFVNDEGKYVAFEHCGSCSISCAFGFPNATAMCDATLSMPACVVDSCDPGYYKINQFQCISSTASLCEPCEADESCLFEGAKCVALDDGDYCSKSCNITADCPAGYICELYEGVNQCLPATGSCSCGPESQGFSKSCSKTFPAMPLPEEPSITCYGIHLCGLDGWEPCVYPEDVCDGADNDCSGAADEAYVDEQGRYVSDEHCGQCGNNCKVISFPNAGGSCNTNKAIPDCQMQCDGGFQDVNGNLADGCECEFSGWTDHPDGIDQNCDGVDGELLNGVFVAKNGDDGNIGTIDEPMLTVNAAISRALFLGKRDVYVATGVYSESVVLQPAVNLYGGYSSDFKVRDVALYETVIMGLEPSVQFPGAVTVGNVADEPTTLDGFTIFGFDTDEAGSSSYGIYVRDCTANLVVRNNHVYAGNGGDGDGGADGEDGADGIDGGGGSGAYMYATTSCNEAGVVKQGGSAGVMSCGAVDVSGGGGGHSYCPTMNAEPDNGEYGLQGLGPGAGAGGGAGFDAVFLANCGLCNVPAAEPMDGADGIHGADGVSGAAGPGCSDVAGTVAGGLWVPSNGGVGGPGLASGGGGGGGAGAGVDNLINCNEQIGGTGGGGASGACGGTVGLDGGGGGGSFGLFLYYSVPGASVPVVESNYFLGGKGGSGGHGGSGGTGGVGGTGGSGGLESGVAWCARKGGNGGNGGIGGHGGGGGGGCGGVSYATFAFGHDGLDLSAVKADNTLAVGNGGSGGSGGPSIGNPGGLGSAGMSSNANF